MTEPSKGIGLTYSESSLVSFLALFCFDIQLLVTDVALILHSTSAGALESVAESPSTDYFAITEVFEMGKPS